MRNLQYPVRTVRLSDDIWKELKKRRLETKQSWNIMIKELLGIKTPFKMKQKRK